MNRKDYKNRHIDELIKQELYSSGAVVIEGIKWCGKTTTSEEHANSCLYIDEPTSREDNIRLSETNPQQLLDGEHPRLIDEWQIAPKLWDAARFNIDRSNQFGLYIFTGSANPVNDKAIFHSGTGRFSHIRMRTMTLSESGESSNTVSLKKLFNKTCKKVEGYSDLELKDVSHCICRGGWPESLKMSKENSLRKAKGYYKSLVERDINRADGSFRHTTLVYKFMKSYARNQGTQASIQKICSDIQEHDNTTVNQKTISEYIEVLKRIYAIDEVEAWNPNLRSKVAIRTTDTRYFTDPSIAAAALGAGPNALLKDIKTFGFLFETLVIRDLKSYVDTIDANVFHYRDASGHECDAVVQKENGDYGLIEIKTGGDHQITEACKNLLKLKKKINTDKMPAPSFLAVITANGYAAYTNDDGIHIIPIGSLTL